MVNRDVDHDLSIRSVGLGPVRRTRPQVHRPVTTPCAAGVIEGSLGVVDGERAQQHPSSVRQRGDDRDRRPSRTRHGRSQLDGVRTFRRRADDATVLVRAPPAKAGYLYSFQLPPGRECAQAIPREFVRAMLLPVSRSVRCWRAPTTSRPSRFCSQDEIPLSLPCQLGQMT